MISLHFRPESQVDTSDGEPDLTLRGMATGDGARGMVIEGVLGGKVGFISGFNAKSTELRQIPNRTDIDII